MSLVGRLEDLALSDIFQILSIGKKTGTLILRGSRGNALVVFRNGLVVRAETSDLEGTLGEDLLRAGVLKDTMLNLASEVKKKLPSKSLPVILYELGSVPKEVIEKITKKRIERVVCQLLVWHDGDFQFEPDDTDPGGKADVPDLGWEIAKGMSPEYLLMEGARVHDESSQGSTVATEDFLGIRDEGDSWEEEWDIRQPAERKDISSLRALTQELRFPNSSSEITLLILRFASDMFSRGVLFMVGDTEIVGLGQFGLDIDQPDETIRKTMLSYNESPFLKKILSEKRPYKGPLAKDGIIQTLIESIGGQWPDEVAFFPIVAEGKVVALLFSDNVNTGESLSESEGLEIFIDQAGLALEKSLLQRRLQEMEKRSKN